MPFTMRGHTATVMYAWHRAASLGPWTLTGKDDDYQLIAELRESDPFRIAQTPLTFVHTIDGRIVRWPIASLAITGAVLTAALSAQE